MSSGLEDSVPSLGSGAQTVSGEAGPEVRSGRGFIGVVLQVQGRVVGTWPLVVGGRRGGV